MSITSEEANKMLVEAVSGKKDTSFQSKEHKVFYKRLKKEVKEMMAKGFMPMPTND